MDELREGLKEDSKNVRIKEEEGLEEVRVREKVK